MTAPPVNYLELNWLRKDKDIILPKLVFIEEAQYGGCYYHPSRMEILIDGRYYSLDRGLIVCVTENENDFIINSLAHEYRHHWQKMNGIKSDGKGWHKGDCRTYKKRIVNYFRQSKTEMDALKFSNAMHPCDVTLQWHEWIIESSSFIPLLKH